MLVDNREPWHDAVGEPAPRWWRYTAIAVVVAFCALLATGITQGAFERRRRERMRVTMQNLREIGLAIERGTAAGAFPCIRRGTELPAPLAATLPPDTLLDGWGRRIITMAGPRRYVVMSLGVDGKDDARQEQGTFEGSEGDVIFSNGEWIRHSSDLATAPNLLPHPDDALAEASSCGTASPDSPPDHSQFYLYLPTEEDAHAAARTVAQSGFASSVRRAASGREWICIAAKKLADPFEPVVYLWRVEKQHGGCAGCDLD